MSILRPLRAAAHPATLATLALIVAVATVVAARAVGGGAGRLPATVTAPAGLVPRTDPAAGSTAPAVSVAGRTTATVLLPGAPLPAPAPTGEATDETAAIAGPGDTASGAEPPAPPPPTPITRRGRLAVSDGATVSVLDLGGASAGEPRALVEGAQPAWHPDGRRVAFVWNRSVWVVDAADPSRPVLVAMGSAAPAFSPAGQWLAVERVAEAGTEVWVMNADGTLPQPVAGLAALGNTAGPTWSPDGKWLAVAFGRPGTNGGGGIAVVPSSGGPPSVLVADASACCGLRHPAWSPDGSKLAYVAGDPARPGEAGELRAVDIATKAVTVIAPSVLGPLAWSPEGVEVAAFVPGTGLAGVALDGIVRPIAPLAAPPAGLSWR